MFLDALTVCLAGLLAVAVLMTVTAFVAKAISRVAVVDVAWGAGFVLVALVSLVVGITATDGDTGRRWLLLVLVAIWGLRLAWHIRKRAVGQGEDPRYEKQLGGTLEEVGMAVAVKKVFAIQGPVLWFVALPVMVGAAVDVRWWWIVVVGVVVWLVGVVFESVGDQQMTAYKAQPKETRPIVMETGLWHYTRHPNYFGDACVWWGLWLVGGLGSGWVAGLVTVLCPLAMTFFLVFATGAKLLEQTMMKRDGYPEYAERTSMFFPLPPRRS